MASNVPSPSTQLKYTELEQGVSVLAVSLSVYSPYLVPTKVTKAVIPSSSSQDLSTMTDASKIEDTFAYSHGITEDEAAERLLHYGTQSCTYVHTVDIYIRT